MKKHASSRRLLALNLVLLLLLTLIPFQAQAGQLEPIYDKGNYRVYQYTPDETGLYAVYIEGEYVTPGTLYVMTTSSGDLEWVTTTGEEITSSGGNLIVSSGGDLVVYDGTGSNLDPYTGNASGGNMGSYNNASGGNLDPYGNASGGNLSPYEWVPLPSNAEILNSWIINDNAWIYHMTEGVTYYILINRNNLDGTKPVHVDPVPVTDIQPNENYSYESGTHWYRLEARGDLPFKYMVEITEPGNWGDPDVISGETELLLTRTEGDSLIYVHDAYAIDNYTITQPILFSARLDGTYYFLISGNSLGEFTILAPKSSILEQPADAFAVSDGYATFSVQATGANLEYQWQYKAPNGKWKNSSSKTDGFNGDTLYVQGVGNGVNHNGYQYRCVITDIVGDVMTSEAAVLDVIDLTAQPQSVVVTEADTAVFRVQAAGDSLTYQWQYQTPNGSWKNCSARTAGYNTDTLTVAAVSGSTNRNGYQYRCLITDAAGNTAESLPATLEILQPLEILSQTTSVSVSADGTAVFAVEASGTHLTYQWQYLQPNGRWKNCSSATEGYQSAALYVRGQSGSTNRNGYQYRCVITDAVGNTVTSEAAVLTVTPVFEITAQPEDACVDPAEQAVFHVEASGAELTYQWQYLQPNTRWKNCSAKTEGYNTDTLKVEGGSRDGYQYRCVITDVYGDQLISDAATLNVAAVPFEITEQPEPAYVAAEDYAVFFVQATGTGLTYQWQYKTPTGNWKNCSAKTEGFNSTALYVQGATDALNRNGYQYRCVVTDGSGNQLISDAATLSVFAITAQPQDAVTTAAETADFTVRAMGIDLIYQWQYKTPTGDWKDCSAKTAGYNTDTLTVEGGSRNGYQYRCIITDLEANTLVTDAVTLTVS